MQRRALWALPMIVAALIATALTPAHATPPPVVADPTEPSVTVISPANSDCEPWDFAKTREENEVVPCPWFPSIAKLANGDLLLGYTWGVSHSFGGSIEVRRSTDDGATWSAPQVVVPPSTDPLVVDIKEPNLTVLDDGTVLMAYWDYAPGRQNRRQVYVIRSTDNGLTWSAPIRPTTSMYSANKGSVATNGEMIQLSSGDLLLPIYGMKAVNGSLGYNGVHVLRSTDRGVSWDPADETVAMWEGPTYVEDQTIGYVEPAITELEDGTIMIVARTQNNGDVSRSTQSTDGGLTWSTPVDIPTVKAHAPHFLTLNDGSRLLTYGDRSHNWGVRPVAARIYDESTGWADTETTLIYRNPGTFADMSYPGSVQLDDGRIFTVYYDRGPGILAGTYSTPEDFRVPACTPATTIKGNPPAGSTTIDLPAMAAANQLTVTTDMMWTNATRPNVGPLGAVDGSHLYWDSAMANRTAPPDASYILDLGSARDLAAIGLTLKPGYAESATVHLSDDGVSWDWCAAAAMYERNSHLASWISFADVTTARYVKVTITDAEGWAMLTELQLAEAPSFAAVRSHVDQAERAGTLTGDPLVDVRMHLDKAEMLVAKGNTESVLDHLANAARKSGAAPDSNLVEAITALADAQG